MRIDFDVQQLESLQPLFVFLVSAMCGVTNESPVDATVCHSEQEAGQFVPICHCLLQTDGSC